ncbi:hypothetical protein V2W45_1234166 [Cenococcum geophilum]
MLLAFGTVSLARGFYTPLSTLSKLNGNKLVTAHLAIIFLLVNTLSRIGLYREVKYSLPTISTLLQFSRLT